MKLTKGKIRKLYNKEKQSKKRYINKGSQEHKTFRKKHHLNLDKKTLKRMNYRGGDGSDSTQEQMSNTIPENVPTSATASEAISFLFI
jgi:6-phosphofructokinase